MTRIDPADEDWMVGQCDGLGDDRLDRDGVWCVGYDQGDTFVTFAPTRGKGVVVTT
jgi:hypothetical protein